MQPQVSKATLSRHRCVLALLQGRDPGPGTTSALPSSALSSPFAGVRGERENLHRSSASKPRDSLFKLLRWKGAGAFPWSRGCAQKWEMALYGEGW